LATYDVTGMILKVEDADTRGERPRIVVEGFNVQ
jgi:hypothetical protein